MLQSEPRRMYLTFSTTGSDNVWPIAAASQREEKNGRGNYYWRWCCVLLPSRAERGLGSESKAKREGWLTLGQYDAA